MLASRLLLTKPSSLSHLAQHLMVNMSTSTSPRRFQAVIFDMGGVMIPDVFHIFTHFETAHSLPVDSITGTMIKAGASGSHQRMERGLITLQEMEKELADEYSRLYGKTVDFKDLFTPWLASPSANVDKRMTDCVKHLKAQGLRTALLTNNFYLEDGSSFQPVPSQLFDVVIESCRVGYRKPDPRIYNLCVEGLGVQPDKCVFLDDIGFNLKPAVQMGMQTIKVVSVEQALNDLESVLGFPVTSSPSPPGTGPCREGMMLDTSSLMQYLDGLVGVWDGGDAGAEPPIVRQFTHGQSNPTYHIYYRNKELVLRKKPPGHLLPSAHAVDREWKVMEAVGRFGVPIPPLLAWCPDASVLGTEFYVMGYVPGVVYNRPDLPNTSPSLRHHLHTSGLDTLAKLHSIDPAQAGLEGFGRPDNYLARQLKRWGGQYKASCEGGGGEVEGMAELITWLQDHLQENQEMPGRVVHGDYRLDNLIFSTSDSATPTVLAVLDWELSTLGDPLCDLAVLLAPYYFPSHLPLLGGWGGGVAPEGLPTEEECLKRYSQQVGLPQPPSSTCWTYYKAFTCFRFAAICHGVYQRSISGQASAPNARQVGAMAGDVARVGLGLVRGYSTSSSQYFMPTANDLPSHALSLYNRVKSFIYEKIIPLEPELTNWMISNPREPHPKLEALTKEAKSEGLWNLFIPPEYSSAYTVDGGVTNQHLTNQEYAHLAEMMGRCVFSSEVFNCSAPDTGNMEVLLKYGTEEQKRRWLVPLMAGEIRSCFGMTEPEVASSDPTNLRANVKRDGEDYVVNGVKWWTSGAAHPRCRLCIFIGRISGGDDQSSDQHKRHSMLLIPMDAPGVTVVRDLAVYGSFDLPHGHCEVRFDNVRVPMRDSILLGEGRGFEIAQGRLGPGRIHHCMRLVGHAERALSIMCERVGSRYAWGKPLAEQGTIQKDIADSRAQIEQARLLVLKAAYTMDCLGNKAAARDIALIKVVAPNMACDVIDRAIQSLGGGGFSQDYPLAMLWIWARVLRMADGPDEVHRRTVARTELKLQAANLAKL